MKRIMDGSYYTVTPPLTVLYGSTLSDLITPHVASSVQKFQVTSIETIIDSWFSNVDTTGFEFGAELQIKSRSRSREVGC